MIAKNKSLSVMGVQKRRGRPPKFLTYSFDQCADKGFVLAGMYIERVQREWNTLSLEQQAESVTRILPLALKRIPDKHEITALTLNVSTDDMQRLIAIAERNMLIRKDLELDHDGEVIQTVNATESESGA